MTVDPVVSVVIPAHNAAAWLRETIDSVLTQSFADFELIIVDDASSDGTPALAAAIDDRRIRVIASEQNRGAAETRNHAISVARGEFVAFLDADDVAPRTRLERQVAFLRANPEIDLCGGWAQTFGARDEIWTAYPRHDQIKAELLFRSGFIQSTIMCRRASLERHDLRYDPRVPLSEDYDLWTRCADLLRMANLGEVLVRYRIHGGNASIRRAAELRGYNRDIRLRQLAKLGIRPTVEEAALHADLFEYGPTGPSTMTFDLDEVERWLMRLREANRQSSYVPEAAMQVVLYEFWRRCCLGNDRAIDAARFLRSDLLRGTPMAWRLRDSLKAMLGLPHFPLPRV